VSTDDKIRVLVFPCGSEPALEIHTALRYCVNIELHGASSRHDHGEFVYRNYAGGVPYLGTPEFLTHFNAILRERKIDVVFGTHDTVTHYLSQNRAAVAARLCLGDEQTVALCRSKADTYTLFADEPFCPRVYRGSELSSIERFPIFLKPSVDEGGKGARLVANREELDFFLARTSIPIVMEYLPGEEYTVDCFTDRHGRLRFAGARTRERVWAGISVRSRSLDDEPAIQAIAARINERLRFRGLWFFQLKRDSLGQLRLLEISSRVAGTMNLYRARGVNFPLLTVYDAMDKDVAIAPNRFPVTVERALFSRYRLDLEYDTIYVDLDDTLIHNGRVNGLLMMLLYQARAEGKRLILVTKHEADLNQTLAEHRIDRLLFDQIMHLTRGERKVTRMNNLDRSIFIDNAFNERSPAQDMGIPVFDVDAVYGLIDWRD
jgi:hypothetical protein